MATAARPLLEAPRHTVPAQCGGASLDRQTAHDTRYDVAHDYIDVVYKLWEGSWDDDADGFNISYATVPGTFVDFIDLVVPELQRRGVYKRTYTEGTFREKLFGAGRARLTAPHPAAAYRQGRGVPE